MDEKIRPAKREDLISDGKVIPGKILYLKSFYNNQAELEKYSTREETSLEDLIIFIDEGHCFVPIDTFKEKVNKWTIDL